MRFQVLVDDEPREVPLACGSEEDLRAISHWRMPATAGRKPAVRDTVEFARLASKRFRHYLRSIPTARNLQEFRDIIRHDALAEVSLLLLVRADWFQRSPVLGLAQCRRTYRHHLVLEFLSVHPAIVGGVGPEIRGVGKGLVYGLAELVGGVGVPLVWGEPTAHSAPFYSRILEQPGIQDHFFIHEETLARCRQEFREKFMARP